MKGSCLCKTVQYEVDRMEMPIVHCHCLTCQKAQGSAFATIASVKRAHFRWTAGEASLTTYESSPGKLRRFCSRCGTPMVAERQGLPTVAIRAATFDEDPGVRPALRIWRSHDLPWVHDEGAVQSHDQWQPGR